MARLSLATNLEAAISLRSRYHSKAAADSNLAFSSKSTALLVMLESGRKLFPHLFPRDHLRFSRVYVRNPAGDLFLPGLLGSFVHNAVEAGEQGIGQRRPLVFGKGKCLLEQVKSLLRHEVIIPLRRRLGSRFFERSVQASVLHPVARRATHPSFRTEQADFFFRIRSCECVGLRREKSLFL